MPNHHSRTALSFQTNSGRLPVFGIAVLTGFFGLLFTGWVIASYRMIGLWTVLGLAAAYSEAPEAMESTNALRPSGGST